MKIRTQIGQSGPPNDKPNQNNKFDTWKFEVSRILDLTDEEEQITEDLNLYAIAENEDIKILQESSSLILYHRKELEYEEFIHKKWNGIIGEMKDELDEKIKRIYTVLEKEFNSG